MPIEHHKGGTTITGDSISYFRLCAMRGAVDLESKGIYLRRRRVWTQAKREFGLKGTVHDVLHWLNAKVEEQRALQEHIDEDGRRWVGGQEVT